MIASPLSKMERLPVLTAMILRDFLCISLTELLEYKLVFSTITSMVPSDFWRKFGPVVFTTISLNAIPEFWTKMAPIFMDSQCN